MTRKAKVMIVEDERIVALDLRRSLESLGYTVSGVAANAAAALALCERERPDVVLMDIHIEGPIDGTVLAHQVRERYRVPVVYLTAYAEQETLQRAEQSLPYGYLLKPFDTRELDAALRVALVRRQSELGLEQAERRLRLAVDAAALGVWEWDETAKSMSVEGHFGAILGDAPEVLETGLPALLLRVHEDDRLRVAEALGRGVLSDTVRMSLREGHHGWADLHARSYQAEERDGGVTTRVVGVVRDVTEREESRSQLRQASVVFRTSAEGVAVTDAKRRVVSVNATFEALTGYPQAQVLGRDLDDFLHVRPHSDTFYARLVDDVASAWHGEVELRRADQGVFPAWQHICAVMDETGQLTHYVLAFSDISVIRNAQSHIRHLAYHDPLTGLGNRLTLHERLDTELRRTQRNQLKLGLLLLDLDGFKFVNDSLGHASGDRLLQAVAERLSLGLRESDVATRLGGDEFVIILPDLARDEDAALVAGKLLDAVRAPINLGLEAFRISASIGIAVYPDNGSSRDELLQAADAAMYVAKAQGRDGFAYYSAEMAERARWRLRVEQQLRLACERQEFVLYYQPVVNLADGVICGVEALVRWQHPHDGLVLPGEFIGIAEDCGLILPIGRWVLQEACCQARTWQDAGFAPLRISVNVSVRQMREPSFTEQVAAVLAATGLAADRLEIEITESTLQSVPQSQDVVARLHELGVAVALDDFGTGYSSLSLLRHLSIDRIKIDRSFVCDLPEDPACAQLTRTLVQLGQGLGLQLTAEGIETAAQARFLADLGALDGQGYLYARPMPAQAVQALLQRGRLHPG